MLKIIKNKSPQLPLSPLELRSTGQARGHQSGVTLLEMLVAVSLFSVVVLAATGIFKMVTEGQRNAIAAQNIQENMRYAFEAMSKEIRMAQKSEHNCESVVGDLAVYKVYNVTANIQGDILYFKNKNGDCVAYYLEDDAGISRLKVYRGTSANFITPNEIKVSNLKFNVIDDDIGAFHTVQPLVLMTMEVEAIGKAMHKQSMRIQTAVSSRYYE